MDIRSLGRTLLESEKIYRRQVERAWSSMLDTGEVADGRVRDVIRQSWMRCLHHGVAPVAGRPPLVGNGARLETLRQANEELLLASQNTWQLLADVLADTNSVMIVSDPQGAILDICGTPKLIEKAERSCIKTGHDWSELGAGTNAVGTAIALKRPAEVHSVEHFCAIAQLWSCSAAPIRDMLDGDLLGVIDVTTVAETFNSQSLALVVTAANQIEQTMQSRELGRCVQLLHWYHGSANRWSREALILLDRKGRVVTANDHARVLFENSGAAHALERGRVLLPAGARFSPESCARHMPPQVRLIAVEAYGQQPGWEGGLLIVEPVRRISVGTFERQRPQLREATLETRAPFGEIVGANPQIVELKNRALRMARASAPVLILGETGCGKELFARAIHQASAVRDGPFVAVNCGTLTRELAASELFGYEPGAFTGASAKGRAGKFEEAHGGTLFLDEIGELPLDIQVGLLRVLQDNVVVRLGSNRERQIKVRIIAATNRPLEDDVRASRFRNDLYYRLKVLALKLPPLRERLGDLEALIAGFLGELEAAYGLGARGVDPTLLERLRAYAWPGNVRELRATIESMYVLSDGEVLGIADLPEGFAAPASGPALPEPKPLAPQPAADATLSGLEREAIVAALAAHGGNLSKAARRLGISRSTLYRRLKHYALDRA
ncbi:MAG: sigma-54-dependent Fis family transcriptional regulator [Gammaproteobacteria bacterium]|nr:sigma-54-dependent Fis family transcriptional regulator [Gammaproteobacteria bacterium]